MLWCAVLVGLVCPPRLVTFFFQAEDGIRDYKVTGVQTCALPIYKSTGTGTLVRDFPGVSRNPTALAIDPLGRFFVSTIRSEERRVGKEWRSRRAREAQQKTILSRIHKRMCYVLY